MSRHAPWSQLIAGLALLLALVATPATAAAAQASESFIEFHVAECPADVADLFAECHDNRIAGVGIVVGGMGGAYEVTTDGGGVANAVHGAGPATIQEDPAVVSNYLGIYVYCSVQNADPQTVLVDGRADTGLFTLDVAPGDEVVCDVYHLGAVDAPPSAPPEPADPSYAETGTVAILKVDEAGAPLPGSCFTWRTFDPPNGPQGAMCDGNTGHAPIDPDGADNGTITWRVPAGIPVEVWEVTAPAGYAAAASQTVTVAPGGTETLTFVNTAVPPAPGVGTIQILKLVCPSIDPVPVEFHLLDLGAAPETSCEVGADIGFIVFDAHGNEHRLTTDGDGWIVLPDVPVGETTIVERGTGASFAFTLTADGALVVVQNVVPPPSAVVVTQLPNTGTGPMADGVEVGGFAPLAALLLIGSIAASGLRRRASRSILLARVILAVALALMTAVPLLTTGGAALAKPDRADPALAALCAGDSAHGKRQITALTITIDRLEPVAEEATASDAAIQEPAVAQDACAMLEATLADTLAEGTVDPATACIVTGRDDRVVSTSPGCARPADPDKRRNVPCLASSAAAIAGPPAAAGSNITATASCAGLPATSFAMVPFGGGGGAMAVGPVVNIFPWGCVIAVVLAPVPGVVWLGVCA